MKGILSSFLIFTAGAAIGSVVTWKLVKTKYEQIAQEEIESVKEAFARRAGRDKKEEDKPVEQEKKIELTVNPERIRYEDIIDEQNYDYPREDDDHEKPYVISPEEFGEVFGYETVNLSFYAGDNVLTDELDDIIYDVEGTVGLDFADHFGEYEDDSVHVRNDKLKIDYEILLDPSSYEALVGNRPHQSED